MKITCLLFLPVILFACSQKKETGGKPHTLPQTKQQAIALNYDSCRKLVELTRQSMKPHRATMSKARKEKIFTACVTETLIPAWIGTPWNFNGTTEKPQEGSIACGYFVTTVLRDAGLNLARVKLAQCASEQMITSLVQPKYIHRFSQVKMNDFIASIRRQGYGLYIVGLDNHTGFIYHDGKNILFIHSTYVGTRNVQKENAVTSWLLDKSKYKVLGKISSDEQVLNRWIN